MKKIFVTVFFALLTLLLLPAEANAQACDANVARWNETTRELEVCVGGFSSVDELRGIQGELECLNNSNTPNAPELLSLCRDVRNSTFSGAIVNPCNPGEPNCLIGQNANGLFTCFLITGIPRAVGVARVNFSGTASCATPQQNTQPADWNIGQEGLPWSDPNAAIRLPVCSGNRTTIDTAIGCIPFDDTDSIVSFFLRWAVGIGGGIALLMMLIAGFNIMTSSGDPKKLQAGKELLGAAVSGLVLLIFSVVIVRILGIDILGIFN